MTVGQKVNKAITVLDGVFYPLIKGPLHKPGVIVHPSARVEAVVPILPPWFEYRWSSSTTAVLIDNPGGVSTNPTTTARIADAMVQTVDGSQLAPHGTGAAVELGTVLGNLKITVDDPGVQVGSSTGVYVLSALGDALPIKVYGSEASPFHGQVIGTGYIKSVATGATFTAHLINLGSTATIYVPNIPDVSPPNSGVANFVRIDWPFTWDTDDILFSGTFVYAAETLG